MNKQSSSKSAKTAGKLVKKIFFFITTPLQKHNQSCSDLDEMARTFVKNYFWELNVGNLTGNLKNELGLG